MYAFDNIRGGMGIKKLEDLDILYKMDLITVT